MSATRKAFLFFLCSITFISAGVTFAQEKTMAQLQAELATQWLVTVDGETRTRILRINGIAVKATDRFLLDADYGWSDGRQTAVKAEIAQNAQERKLILTTQANTKIVATQSPDGSFSGTFALKDGTTKGLTMTKLSATDLQALKDTELTAVPTIEKPSADVPAACAAYVGGWSGDWPYVGKIWFWVVGADAKCVIKYSYGTNYRAPTGFKTAEVKNGIVVIPLSKGATAFELKGESLVGTYSGSDGSNNATMQRIQLGGDALAKLRAEQKALQTITPPAADVPASCAAFGGKWTGTWGYGIGQTWLWVASIDAKCVAKIAYRDDNRTPIAHEAVEIKDGALKWLCNKSTSGTCILMPHGDELWASYSNPGGGTNSAVFKRIQ